MKITVCKYYISVKIVPILKLEGPQLHYGILLVEIVIASDKSIKTPVSAFKFGYFLRLLLVSPETFIPFSVHQPNTHSHVNMSIVKEVQSVVMNHNQALFVMIHFFKRFYSHFNTRDPCF